MSDSDKLIDIFWNHIDWFGCDPDDSPDELSEINDNLANFEGQFRDAVCEIKGHHIIDDQCNMPEHRYCAMCLRLESYISEAEK